MSSDPSGKDIAISDVERFLREVISLLEPDTGSRRGRGRPAVLPAMALWAGLLVCVLRGMNSQLAVWRLLSATGLWDYPRFPVCDQAVYNRLARDGVSTLQWLFHQISGILDGQFASGALKGLAPFATHVYALDESTLDKVARLLPALRGLPAGDSRLLPGRLSALFDLRKQQWRRVEHVPDPLRNEKLRARKMVEDLEKGSLILCDLGYFAFAWFDWLTDHDYYWISRLRARTSYEILHQYYEGDDILDAIIYLGKYRADRAAHAVRMVSFRVGNRKFRYITNVLDPQILPIKTIVELYARRWDIELAFNLVKRHLGLHLIWSAKTVVIQQQIWAVLIISQILQALRMKIADRAAVDPFDVSMALLAKYAPSLARDGHDPVEVFVERGRHARFIRPSTRKEIKAPTIPEDELQPMPEGLILVRKPRYAQRKCHRRSGKPNLLE